MSLWADYSKERLGWDMLEEDGKGFLSYSITPPVCTIQDIYIDPNYRHSTLALCYMKEVSRRAKEAGCTHLQSFVWLNSVDCERAVRANLAYGFKLTEAMNNRIMFVKEIGGPDGK